MSQTRRGHLPYGYKIENGIAVICEEEAAQLRKMYEGYLGGLSLIEAAAQVGQTRTHASVKRMLQNPHYLGDEFYPAIIDKETFDAFEAERLRREKALGRDDRQKDTEVVLPAPTAFRMRKKAHVFNDPYRQAEYVYSLIESEV